MVFVRDLAQQWPNAYTVYNTIIRLYMADKDHQHYILVCESMPRDAEGSLPSLMSSFKH